MDYDENKETNLQLSTWVNSYINVLLKTIIEEENKDGQFTIIIEQRNSSKVKETKPKEPTFLFNETNSQSTYLDNEKDNSLESFVNFFICDIILKNAVQQLIDEEKALSSARNHKEALAGLVGSENPMEDYIRYRLKAIYGGVIDDTVLQFVLKEVPKGAEWTDTFNVIDSALLFLEKKYKLEKITSQGQSGRISSTISGKIKPHAANAEANTDGIAAIHTETVEGRFIQGDALVDAAKQVPSSSAVDDTSLTKEAATENVPLDVQEAKDKEHRKPQSRQRQFLSRAKSSFARFFDMFE